MPHIRKLSAAERAALEQPKLGSRAQLARTYDGYLNDFAVGDYGRVELAPGEQRAVVRRRLHAAAARRGLALRFRPGPSAALIFQVIPPRQQARLTLPMAVPRPEAAPSERAARAAPRAPRPRQTASERYRTVLPRWMRNKQEGRQDRSKRRRR